MASEKAKGETPLAAGGTTPRTGETTTFSTAAASTGATAVMHPAFRTAQSESPIDIMSLQLTDDERSHALVKALPPETDPFTYLTIVEYNLSRSSIGLLDKILRMNPQLAADIGWDLVQMLLPLLPYSKPCLDTVAKLGNPREVVIKVNEALEILGLDSARSNDSDDVAGSNKDEDDEDGDNYDASGGLGSRGMMNSYDESPSAASSSAKTDGGAGAAGTAGAGAGAAGGFGKQETPDIALEHIPTASDDKEAGSSTGLGLRISNANSEASTAPEPDVEECFKQMLAMIRVLHPRIKTKRPSKFLVTTVEAILSAFRSLGGRVVFGESTTAVLDLLDDLSSLSKPPLPPRAGSQTDVDRKDIGSGIADDPEAEPVEVDEGVLQGKILISFATSILDVLVMATRRYLPHQLVDWTSRFMEDHFPGRLPQNIMALNVQLQGVSEKIQRYHARILNILSSRLGLGSQRLPSLLPSPGAHSGSSTLSSDLPLSETGALYLLADSEFGRVATGQTKALGGPLDHREIVETYLGKPESLELGPELATVVDAILILGWAWTTNENDFHRTGESQDETQERYNRYLQHLSLVSANAPSPVLRYQVHLFVTKVLHGTRDVALRVGYIRDTLEFCPFENLKVTAVGWLKDEIAAAFGETGMTYVARDADNDLFRQPGTLRMMADALFEQPPPPPPPPPPASLPHQSTAAADETGAEQDGEEEIQQRLPFWLAVLNLLYLLCMKSDISVQLMVGDLARERVLLDAFVEPLDRIARHLLQYSDGPEHSHAGVNGGISGGALLSDAASKARDALRRVTVV